MATAYTKLFNIIREQIDKGVYSAGEKMATERRLCEKYNVSRITIRHALRLLQEQGYIERFAGRGTFVRQDNPTKIPILNADFTGSMRSNAPSLKREILQMSEAEPPQEIAEILGLAATQKCFFAERVDSLDGEPLACDKVWIPLEFAGSINRRMLKSVNFLDLWLEAEHIETGSGVESIEAIAADTHTAKLLGVKKNIPLLKAIDQPVSTTGRTLGIFETFYRGDRYKMVSTTDFRRKK